MAMTKTDTYNYRGELFQSGKKKTPFFNLITEKSMRTNSFLFPTSQTWTLSAASQPSIAEDDSVGTLTPSTTTRTENTNTAQIFQYTVSVSLKKQSTFGFMSGINTNDPNPVANELDFQKMVQLEQCALDMEYSFLNGTYQAAANTATAAKTRGIISAISTNAVAASSASLSKGLIDELLRTMANSGAPWTDPVIFVNGFQKQAFSGLYAFAPQDRKIGGANIQLIETDFAELGIVYDPQVPTDTVLIADVAYCSPVFVPVMPMNGGIIDSMEGAEILWQPTAVTAASYGGFFYSQAGLAYGPETYHGKITGLATS